MVMIQGIIIKWTGVSEQNEDFKKVCDAIHASGMKVMLDGVFNHAGRGFLHLKM